MPWPRLRPVDDAHSGPKQSIGKGMTIARARKHVQKYYQHEMERLGGCPQAQTTAGQVARHRSAGTLHVL